MRLLATYLLIAAGHISHVSGEELPAAECVLTAKRCTNFPKFEGTQFGDRYGVNSVTIANPSACLRRAEDFHHWCGNGRAQDSEPSVSATWVSTGDTQMYDGNACEKDWSHYHGNCYIHVWGSKTWGDAEQWCVEHGGNLASIHGNAENDFITTLTMGLTTWIGYHEKEPEAQEMVWSDDSKTDFENVAKDCTGRENDPDCKPPELAKQWYNWDGQDRATWVCKKPANWGMRIVRGVKVLSELWKMDWGKMMVPQSELPDPIPPSNAANQEAEPKPQRQQAANLDEKKAIEGCVGDCP